MTEIREVKCPHCGQLCSPNGKRIRGVNGSEKVQRFLCKNCEPNKSFMLPELKKKRSFSDETKNFISFLMDYTKINSGEITKLLTNISEPVRRESVWRFMDERIRKKAEESEINMIEHCDINHYINERSGLYNAYWCGMRIRKMGKVKVKLIYRSKKFNKKESYLTVKTDSLKILESSIIPSYFNLKGKYMNQEKLGKGNKTVRSYLETPIEGNHWTAVNIKLANLFLFVFFDSPNALRLKRIPLFINERPSDREEEGFELNLPA